MNLKIRTYDPKLTIKENAEANNVNELTVKRYIKRNGIDRQGERLTTLLDGLIKAYKKDPTLTVYQFANATKKAPQTIIWEKGYTGDTVLKWLYNVID